MNQILKFDTIFILLSRRYNPKTINYQLFWVMILDCQTTNMVLKIHVSKTMYAKVKLRVWIKNQD